MAKDKGKGKVLAIDQNSKPVFKRKKAGAGNSRGGGSGISIREPSSQQTPLGLAQRFHNPKALKRYNSNYISRKISYEKPLVRMGVDPVFLKALTDMGLGELIDVPDEKVNISLVREFFANLDSMHLDEGHVWVRKVKVPCTSEAINKVYKLEVNDEMQEYSDVLLSETQDGLDPLEKLRVEIHEPTPWTLRPNNIDRKEIATANWPEEWRVMCRFIQCRLLPKYNIGHFGIDDLGVLCALHRKLVINVGKLLYKEIVGHVEKTKRCLLVPYLIHRLFRDAKVEEYKSNQTVKKPRGIRMEKNRMKQLAAKEGGPSLATEDATTATAAPTLSGLRSFSKWEKIQLTITESLQSWLKTVQKTQKHLLKNQKRIDKKLKVKGCTTVELETFEYPDFVGAAMRTMKGLDTDTEDEHDASGIDQSVASGDDSAGSDDQSDGLGGDDSVGSDGEEGSSSSSGDDATADVEATTSATAAEGGEEAPAS